MLNNHCPKCHAKPNRSCTLPNGAETVTHKLRNPDTIDGRMAHVLASAKSLIGATGTASAHDVCADMGRPDQYSNVSGSLRVLAELGHLDKVGKAGGRILYGNTQ